MFSAAREIARNAPGPLVLVTKSTVPVGTGDEIERILREKRPDAEIQAVSNPEFLREGAAIQDFKHPDRIVVGSDDQRTGIVGFAPQRSDRRFGLFAGQTLGEVARRCRGRRERRGG